VTAYTVTVRQRLPGVLAGAVHDRDLQPRQPGELVVQDWLVCGHVALGEHGPVVVVQRCRQVHLVACTGRAAQPLAIHREHAAVARRVQPSASHAPTVASTASLSTAPAPGGWWPRRGPGSGG
jgi:hypothetical protein